MPSLVVLNPIFITKCNNLTVMGLQRLYLTFWNLCWTWRCEVISWAQCYFWFFTSTPISKWLKRLSTLDVVAVLTSRSFPIPFCTSGIYIVLCQDMVPEIEKDGNLATSTKLLKSCSLKNRSQSWDSPMLVPD